MTQGDLGERLGISHQAIHKIEAALTRVTVGRLWGLTQALGVGVDYFFEESEDGE
jgi:transcriptional regulator with XRE-family HTH domain